MKYQELKIQENVNILYVCVLMDQIFLAYPSKHYIPFMLLTLLPEVQCNCTHTCRYDCMVSSIYVYTLLMEHQLTLGRNRASWHISS